MGLFNKLKFAKKGLSVTKQITGVTAKATALQSGLSRVGFSINSVKNIGSRYGIFSSTRPDLAEYSPRTKAASLYSKRRGQDILPAVQKIERKKEDTSSITLRRYPEDLNSTFFARIELFDYIRRDPLTTETTFTDAIGVIDLPFPIAFSANDHTIWSEEKISILTRDLYNTFEGAIADFAASGELSTAQIDAIKKTASQGTDPAAFAGSSVVQKLQEWGLTSDLANLFTQTIGAIPNPGLTMFFGGPTLRQYQMTWRFAPYSEAESKQLIDIVGYLRHRMLARVNENDKAYFLDYPSLARIKLYPEEIGGESGWLKFKTAAITGISFDPNAAGATSFHADGTPTVSQLSLDFQEIEYFTSKDYEHSRVNFEGNS